MESVQHNETRTHKNRFRTVQLKIQSAGMYGSILSLNAALNIVFQQKVAPLDHNTIPHTHTHTRQRNDYVYSLWHCLTELKPDVSSSPGSMLWLKHWSLGSDSSLLDRPDQSNTFPATKFNIFSRHSQKAFHRNMKSWALETSSFALKLKISMNMNKFILHSNSLLYIHSTWIETIECTSSQCF